MCYMILRLWVVGIDESSREVCVLAACDPSLPSPLEPPLEKKQKKAGFIQTAWIDEKMSLKNRNIKNFSL